MFQSFLAGILFTLEFVFVCNVFFFVFGTSQFQSYTFVLVIKVHLLKLKMYAFICSD